VAVVVVIRFDDAEDKLVAAAEALVAAAAADLDRSRLAAAVAFQERFFRTKAVTPCRALHVQERLR